MRVPNLDNLAADGFGHWLAGFMDGEGSYMLWGSAARGPYVNCRCQIEVRQDDISVLYEIRERVGLGKVNNIRSRRGNHPGARWLVSRREECLAILPVFDRFPPRAKKARDYAIWREGVIEWNRMHEGPRSGFDWTRMQALHAELAAARAFVEVAA